MFIVFGVFYQNHMHMHNAIVITVCIIIIFNLVSQLLGF